MGHTIVGDRHIYVVLPGATVGSGHDGHVVAYFHFRKQNMLRVNPGKRGSVRQDFLWLTAEDRHNPGVPSKASVRRRVHDARAVRRKDWSHLREIVMGELSWLAIWQ